MALGKLFGESLLKSPVAISLGYQFCVALPIGLLILGLFGSDSATSFLLGVLVFVIPNLYFTLLAFRYKGANLSRWIQRSFSVGESGKFALTMVGFALVFRFASSLQVPVLFAGFIVMIVLQWFVGGKISSLIDEQTSLEVDQAQNDQEQQEKH